MSDTGKALAQKVAEILNDPATDIEKMSDTPRTDAVALPKNGDPSDWVSADFARQLERDLASARAERDKAKARVAEIEGYNVGLAEEVRVIRAKIDNLISAMDATEDLDDGDGQEWKDACANLDAATDALRPHTEAAITLQATLDLTTEQDATIADLRQKLALKEAECNEIAGLNHEQWLELQYLRGVFEAAHALNDESEEYDFPDGMGRGASQSYWDNLNSALEVEKQPDAIIEVIGWKRRAETAEQKLAEANAECFKLAAGTCLCVKGDEYGNAYCEMKQRAETAESKLREWAREAMDDVEDWAGYAPSFFKEKWNLDADLDKWQRRAEGGE